MQRFIAAMDEEYPILEFLHIIFSLEDNSTILRFPKSLQAPYWRQHLLQSFALPIVSRLLTTTVGPVWASSRLAVIHSSIYFHPITPLRWIFLMPHLEKLKNLFWIHYSQPPQVEMQSMHMPIIAPTMLFSHRFHFYGVSKYSEALAHRIITPRRRSLHWFL